jgi:uncharacterized protein YkwD
MKISFLKLRFTLYFAVLVLFISVFSNRITLAKNQAVPLSNFSIDSLPAEYIYTTNLSGITKNVFQKVNYQRKLKKLKPLLWHEKLARLAYDYSEQMATENFFEHIDKEGKSVVERSEDYDLNDWSKIGENLFQCEGYDDPAEIAVKSWIKSRTHRTVMFDREWTHTGIGVYQTKDGLTYITQVFLTK